MKYESITKVERNNDLIKYHREHPELAIREVAEKFGISTQRAHAIIKKGRKM